MIKTVDNIDIDFSKITMVGKVGGDPAWLRYRVYFVGDTSLEIMENRRGCGVQMPREQFVKMWKECNND